MAPKLPFYAPYLPLSAKTMAPNLETSSRDSSYCCAPFPACVNRTTGRISLWGCRSGLLGVPFMVMEEEFLASFYPRLIMVLLLCKFRVSTAIFCASSTSSFHDIVEFACGNWEALNPETISFTYELPGNAMCMLRSDYDLNTLISFACSSGLEHVNVSVHNGPFIPQIEYDSGSQENDSTIEWSSGP
ncbi:hypothetical protein L1049_018347 [Liquidambar formosana]|uniref:Uncharacterized protein n=1 Tax=Liquidambar formosana TaxID=63359 RepID=A0AAP0R9Y8_LIQFO